jgi:isopentenyl-diphosphate Delta-isomerase
MTDSVDSDQLILVDEADREVGHLSKDECHAGSGVLHRAFSLLIFNQRGELLLQQRSEHKRLWPHYWSNSCCSHPRRGESMSAATRRRLVEELGLSCPLRFLFKFQYQAQFDPIGAEHELCSVFYGHSGERVIANRDEIAAWRWIGLEELQRELDAGESRFTPWFLTEWSLIRRDHLQSILSHGAARTWLSH